MMMISGLFLSSCSDDDEVFVEPVIGAIEITPFKNHYLEGERVIFSVPIEVENEHLQDIGWSWRVTRPDGAEQNLDPTHQAQYPELTTTDIGIYTIRCTVNVNGYDYEVQPRQFVVQSHNDDGVDGVLSGSMIFWARGNQITPPLQVHARGVVKQITQLYNATTPTCGDEGIAQWDDVPYGEYSFHAVDAAGVTWDGTYEIDATCNGVKLIFN